MTIAARALLILAAATAAAACNMADDADKRERAGMEGVPKPAAAPAGRTEPLPARARLEALDEAEAPAAAKAEELGHVTRSWFAGKWTDTGDCADAGRFAPDGTYLLADGTRGMWNIQDGRLVVQHEGGRSALQLRRLDESTVELDNADGSTGRSTRCS